MKKLEEGAINGMLAALEDPYTSYFNVEDHNAELPEDFHEEFIKSLVYIGYFHS